MENVNANIDGLSRLHYVLGHENIPYLSSAEVLVCGARGLGIEVAKNVILGGVRSVTVHDTDVCEIKDPLQYDVTEIHGISASIKHLKDLNPCVKVNVHTENLSEDFLKNFRVIVLANVSLEEQFNIGEFAHCNGIALIIANSKGLFGQVFCDFGKDFTVDDMKKVKPLPAMIASITKNENSMVTCLEETRHGFEDGDYVTFSEVQGMIELNGCEPRKVKVCGPHSFGIGDTSNFSDYARGGLASQVNMPKNINFKSFREALNKPEFIMLDFGRKDRPPQLHLAFQGVLWFQQIYNRLPKPWNEEDAYVVLSIVKDLNSSNPNPVELDESLIRKFSYFSGNDHSPVQALIGCITAQEVVKACTGKFHPIVQFLYFDTCECLLEEDSVAQPLGQHYDGPFAVFGTDFQQKLANLKSFIISAAAIGFDHLKIFSESLAAREKSEAIVTDMDPFEKSNPDSQFLFRPWDIGHDPESSYDSESNQDSEGEDHYIPVVTPAVEWHADEIERVQGGNQAQWQPVLWNHQDESTELQTSQIDRMRGNLKNTRKHYIVLKTKWHQKEACPLKKKVINKIDLILRELDVTEKRISERKVDGRFNFI